MRRDQVYLQKKYKILHEIEEEDANDHLPQFSNQITQETNVTVSPPNLTSFNASLHVPNTLPIMTIVAHNPPVNRLYEPTNVTTSRPFNSTVNQNVNQPRLSYSQNKNNTQQVQSFINREQTETSQPQLLQPTTLETRLRSDQVIFSKDQ